MSDLDNGKSFSNNITSNGNTKALPPKKKKDMKKEQEVIRTFLMTKDVPTWYRGTSTFQMKACLSLLNAIRDDIEQSTSHRVRYCLSVIGLDPLVNDSETKFLMRLSRGNDIAFLWFLMELHYKTPGSSYSVNEQLIMSSIAHLDIITTLRELDRILPPGHPSLKRIEQQRKLAKQKQAKVRRKSRKEQNTLPYFQKLVKPKEYGEPLTIPMPDYKVQLKEFYERIRATGAIPNEENRWYTNYQLQPEKRIVNGIIKEEIGNIFKDGTESTLNVKEIRNLCEHHKVIDELEKSLAHQLKVIAKDNCLQYVDVNKKRKEASYKRVMEQLEKDTQLYLCKFRECAQKSRKQTVVRVVTDTGCCQYLVDDEDEAEEPCLQEAICDMMDCMCDKDVKESGDTKICNKCENTSNNKDNRRTSKASRTSMQITYAAGDSIASNNGHNVDAKQFKQHLTSYDYGHMELNTPTPSQKFFSAPVANKPYQFDYRKIFNFQNLNTDEKEVKIRKAIISALDSSEVLEKCINSAPPNLDKAVKNCVQKIWKTEVAKKNVELAAEEARKKAEEEKIPWIFKKDFYDCEDKPLMQHMLKTALEHMSKNPKFVLASIPESDKFPLLREWVYQRYGKRYTKAERFKLFQQSLKIFNTLDKIPLRVEMPNARQLGTELFVDYSCRDYLLKKSQYIKRQYYKKLDKAIMDQARVFWFAMRPYLCSNGPPRNTYFAYMPSRVMDITRFRLWKPTEFMNAKSEWERRNFLRRNMKS